MKNFLVVSAILLSGCSVSIIQKHNPHFKTTRVVSKSIKRLYISNLLEKNVIGNHVERIDGKNNKRKSILEQSLFQCRLTTINLPKGMTVRDYLNNAITDELDAAGILDKKGDPVTVFIHKLDSDTSGFSTGYWYLDFEYRIKGRIIRVATTTEFESAFVADTACRSTAASLSEAIGQNLVALFENLNNS